jgi:hypothetical protein
LFLSAQGWLRHPSSGASLSLRGPGCPQRKAGRRPMSDPRPVGARPFKPLLLVARARSAAQGKRVCATIRVLRTNSRATVRYSHAESNPPAGKLVDSGRLDIQAIIVGSSRPLGGARQESVCECLLPPKGPAALRARARKVRLACRSRRAFQLGDLIRRASTLL